MSLCCVIILSVVVLNVGAPALPHYVEVYPASQSLAEKSNLFANYIKFYDKLAHLSLSKNSSLALNEEHTLKVEHLKANLDFQIQWRISD
jgi:hypothetical protein